MLLNIFKTLLMFFVAGIFFTVHAQNFNVTNDGLDKNNTLGSEVIFNFVVTNTSNKELTLFVNRKKNILPDGWFSSLCFDETCFASFIDSVATSKEYNSSPLLAGEQRDVSLHVLSFQNYGVGRFHIVIGDAANISDTIGYNLTATASVTDVDNENEKVEDYYLSQNFPNPFNPSTIINFGIEHPGLVEIAIYNILGNKIAAIFKGYKTAGNHSVRFESSNLSSGVYFYKIVAGDFVQTKKMILEK